MTNHLCARITYDYFDAQACGIHLDSGLIAVSGEYRFLPVSGSSGSMRSE
ncbi:MAG: hypothetical protein ABI843_07495 [Dokdonella sp.]